MGLQEFRIKVATLCVVATAMVAFFISDFVLFKVTQARELQVETRGADWECARRRG